MIEILKSRRYIGLCIGLVVLCIIVMIFEGLFTGDKHAIHHNVLDSSHEQREQLSADVLVPGTDVMSKDLTKDQKNTACWLHEEFHVIARCSHCSDTEFMTNYTACEKTGFVEQIRCKSGMRVVRSCVHESAIASFFKFELLMIVMSAVGWYVCYRRESILMKAAMDKINKQLSCGV